MYERASCRSFKDKKIKYCTGYGVYEKSLEPLLNEEDIKAEKKWIFDLIIERLKNIRKQTIIIKNKEIKIISTPDEEQKKVPKLLGIKL